MVQCISFHPNVEVNGETVATIINAFPEYLTDFAIKILFEHGIEDPIPGQWYSQEKWLTYPNVGSSFFTFFYVNTFINCQSN